MNPPRSQNEPLDFSVSDVRWGYRDTFLKVIEDLYKRNLINSEKDEITRQFFSTLKNVQRDFFDHVLQAFLKALNPDTHWIMSIPSIFADITDMGIRFAEAKLYYGTTYFKILGEGGLGQNTEQVGNLMSFLKRIWKVDSDLAFAFLKGYGKLLARLERDEIDLYIQDAVEVFQRNRRSGIRFIEGSLKSSETVIGSLSRECRLKDIRRDMARLLRALVGWEVEISDLSQLDAHRLAERGSTMVCMHNRLFLPERLRTFDSKAANHGLYLLMGLTAAGMLSRDSFSCIHGHKDYPTISSLVGGDIGKLNLIQIIEYVRVLNGIKDQWPGARNLIDEGISREYGRETPHCDAQRLLHLCISPEIVDKIPEEISLLLEIADKSWSIFDTASLLKKRTIDRVSRVHPGIKETLLRPPDFLSDFLFPVEIKSPNLDKVVLDLRKQSELRRPRAEQEEYRHLYSEPDTENRVETESRHEELKKTTWPCFTYDEWSQGDNDYFREHCFLSEIDGMAGPRTPIPKDISEQVRKTRRVFEHLKPEVIKKEKYLSDGDMINPDLLVDYLIMKQLEPSPKVSFYEKPMTKKRDLAVHILIDVSGSTGSSIENRQILEIEKYSAVILGQGLESLDDKFSICGFSGQGRENCEFYIFKDFDEPWDNRTINRILKARPRSSTRIGAALRHAGYRLSKIPSKQRLIILITDGKPMDSGYDPATRYAQYDIRMACKENRKLHIHTFGISTVENSRSDMEIMFPGMKFVILQDVRELPKLLPRVYIKLTV